LRPLRNRHCPRLSRPLCRACYTLDIGMIAAIGAVFAPSSGERQIVRSDKQPIDRVEPGNRIDVLKCPFRLDHRPALGTPVFRVDEMARYREIAHRLAAAESPSAEGRIFGE